MHFGVREMRRTVSYVLLGKAVIGGAFAVLTLCGVTLPSLGIEITPFSEMAAAASGGALGIVAALAFKA